MKKATPFCVTLGSSAPKSPGKGSNFGVGPFSTGCLAAITGPRVPTFTLFRNPDLGARRSIASWFWSSASSLDVIGSTCDFRAYELCDKQAKQTTARHFLYMTPNKQLRQTQRK